MGFQLPCAGVPCPDEGLCERVRSAFAEAFPFAKQRTMRQPFLAAVAGMDCYGVLEAYERNPAAFPFKSSEEAEEALIVASEERGPALSRAFPGLAFAYVEVDCFGGTCLFSGSVARDGLVVFEQPSSYDGHRAVLAAAGAPLADWDFPPFRRGWFEGESSSAARRGISGSLDGEIRGVRFELASMTLVADLRPPWKVWAIDKTWLVRHGEEAVFFSLTELPGAGAIALAGRTHAPLEEAGRLLDAVVESLSSVGGNVRLELRDLGRAAVRRWG